MQEENVVIHRDLGNAAVDRAANRLAGPSQIEIDPRGVRPGLGTAFQIVLNVQVLTQQSPFPLITRSLQQFKLMKTRQRCVVSTERTLERGLHPTGAIAKNLDPHRCVDENHPRNLRIAL